MITLILIVGWLVCSFISYGMFVGAQQKQFPELAYRDRYTDRIKAFVLSLLFGPCALVATLLIMRPYHWKL